MTIYEELINEVVQGKSFYINFEKRSMKVGKRYLIKEGEWDYEKDLIVSDGSVLETIEKLYKRYKYSLPSERSCSKRRGYFKALSPDEMTDEMLVYGAERECAQAALEGYILCKILSGYTWEFGDLWFWQSEEDQDLVLLKKWVKGE